MKKFFLITGKLLLVLFALIGIGFTLVFFGMRLGAFNVRGSIAERNAFFGTKRSAVAVETCTDTKPVCDWNGTPEWEAIKGGLSKDAAIINRVAGETGVSPRMIVAAVIPEQTRFFTANREIFKSYFEPLKLLGSLTKFSLGISGIKEETALVIEEHAGNPLSEFYPGPEARNLIAYTTTGEHKTELYNRLTDPKDHYYQYLYTALFIKEIQMQWQRAGYDITEQPGVVVTLFNLGFASSRPNAAPRVAGAPITTGGTTYTYGDLGARFYESLELRDIFPE